MKSLSELGHFFALKRSTVGLLAMVVLVGMGEYLAERFLPIYIIALGGGAMVIGLLQAMDNFLSAIYSYPGGYLSERLGTKRALLLFTFISIIGYLIVVLFPVWQAVLVGAAFFISWSALSLPATMSLIYKVLPQHKRTMGVSMYSLTRRIPMALGPLIGGMFIVIWGERLGVRAAFLFAIVLALIAMIFQQRLIDDDTPRERDRKEKPEWNPMKLFPHMNPALKQLLVSDILIRFCEQIPYAFVVVWCMKIISAPVTALEFGLLTTIEMAVAAVCYIPVAYWADRSEKKPFVVITFVFFTFFPLVLMYSHSFVWLILAFVLRGLKEFGDATRKSLIMDLSPAENGAVMFGLYYLIRDVIVSVATFGGALLWMIDPKLNLLTAFAFGILGTLYFAFFGKSYATETHQAAA
ncbi:MFS transporter [bacterium]|nr:MFS transporter [bacterium]